MAFSLVIIIDIFVNKNVFLCIIIINISLLNSHDNLRSTLFRMKNFINRKSVDDVMIRKK